MTKNGYPEKFFDEIVRSFLNKILEKAPTELIAPKRVVVFFTTIYWPTLYLNSKTN